MPQEVPSGKGSKKVKVNIPILVAEPRARANSFVGTEEYLAPEVINAGGHSSGVDWWSYGILLYELLYGTTPFRGARRDDTFENILSAQLTFPAKPQVSPACQVGWALVWCSSGVWIAGASCMPLLPRGMAAEPGCGLTRLCPFRRT